MSNAIKLTEAQMRDFVAKGYVSFKLDLPESFHREIYETTEKVFERVGNPGNNILALARSSHTPLYLRTLDLPEKRVLKTKKRVSY